MLVQDFAEQRVDGRDGVNLVAPKLDAVSLVLIRRVDLDGVAAHAETSAVELDVGALVLQFDELLEKLFARDLHPRLDEENHIVVGVRVAEAVDAGDRGDDDHVAPLEERARRGEAQAVNLLVDGRLLFDVGVRGRDVGLRLVVVVVGDEILDRIFGEEGSELLVELRGQSLVVGDDERGALRALDHGGDREGLARTRDAEQDLILRALVEPADERVNRLRLIALRLEVGTKLEWHKSRCQMPDVRCQKVNSNIWHPASKICFHAAEGWLLLIW